MDSKEKCDRLLETLGRVQNYITAQNFTSKEWVGVLEDVQYACEIILKQKKRIEDVERRDLDLEDFLILEARVDGLEKSIRNFVKSTKKTCANKPCPYFRH